MGRNSVIYSVLEQVVWQEGLGHCCNMGGKHCHYSVLGQVGSQEGLNHFFNMGEKHCNSQCFGTSCVAKKDGPLLQHGCLGQVVWQGPQHCMAKKW